MVNLYAFYVLKIALRIAVLEVIGVNVSDDVKNYEFNFLSISTQFTFNVGWVDFLYSIPTK